MDLRRGSVFAALVVGCLVVTQAMGGCSGSGGGGGGGTGGTGGTTGGTDGGTGGTTTGGTDGGTGGGTNTACENLPTDDHKIGAPCTSNAASNAQPVQGNCDTGLLCAEPQVSGGTCTKQCGSDADCDSQSMCEKQSPTDAQGACIRTCDTGVVGSCGRPDMNCLPTAAGSTKGVCVNNCNCLPNNDCGQNATCDTKSGNCMPTGNTPAYGSCATEPCQAGLIGLGADQASCICFPDCTGGKACPGTDVCALGFTDPSGAKGQACLPDCSQGQQCPANTGWTCQSAGSGKVCFTPPPAGTQSAYDTCDQSHACKSGLACLGNGTSGRCLQGPCTTDADCSQPAGSKCNVSVKDQAGNQFKFCGVPCTAGQTTCPTGTTCQQQGICL